MHIAISTAVADVAPIVRKNHWNIDLIVFILLLLSCLFNSDILSMSVCIKIVMR